VLKVEEGHNLKMFKEIVAEKYCQICRSQLLISKIEKKLKYQCKDAI
jgi:hypothetical protein